MVMVTKPQALRPQGSHVLVLLPHVHPCPEQNASYLPRLTN